MIYLKEIRIGNCVDCIGWGYHKWRQIDFEMNQEEEERYNPIPLTPEILVKAGFVKDRYGWELPYSRLSLTDKLYPCWFDKMIWPQDIPDFKGMRLEYLHQLQNLYFALTGEELNIEL